VKMRQDGRVENRAVYTAIGINVEGQNGVDPDFETTG
jgi:transposase-like protein